MKKILVTLFFGLNFISLGFASDQEIFDHGTNTFFANYVCKGININYGRTGLDFNSKSNGAFYLTSDFALAKKWANIKSEIFGREPRVISYRVNKNFRNKFNVMTLENKSKWETFVQQSRLNINIHSYDFVEGSIFKNPYENLPAEQSGYQSAVTSDIMAKYFSTMIVDGCQSLSPPIDGQIIDEKT